MTILKGNADLVPAMHALLGRHPIILSDGRVPCDICDAAITTTEAERHFDAWMQHICDHCAGEYTTENAELERESVAAAVDAAPPSAPPDARSDLIEAALAGGSK